MDGRVKGEEGRWYMPGTSIFSLGLAFLNPLEVQIDDFLGHQRWKFRDSEVIKLRPCTRALTKGWFMDIP